MPSLSHRFSFLLILLVLAINILFVIHTMRQQQYMEKQVEFDNSCFLIDTQQEQFISQLNTNHSMELSELQAKVNQLQQELENTHTFYKNLTSSIRKKKKVLTLRQRIEQQFYSNFKIPLRVEWMKSKISHSLPQWLESGILNEKKFLFEKSPKKKILIFNYLYSLGWNGMGVHPRGELSQWTDLMMALSLQNYHVYYVHDLNEFVQQVLPQHELQSFDVIFTDYSVLKIFFSKQLNLIQQKDVTISTNGNTANSQQTNKKMESNNLKCRLRVLDSFGTTSNYNSMNLSTVMKNNRNMGPYCCWNLEMKQYLTFQPRKIPDPVNQFLGTAIPFSLENLMDPSFGKKVKNSKSGKYRALIWAKETRYFEHVPSSYLEIISQKFELLTTLAPTDFQKVKSKFPKIEFTNLGILPSHQLYVEALKESVIYVGLGEPLIGPSCLEALAYGAVIFNPFINAQKLSDMGKPSDEVYTSQAPYLESIGAPNAITLNMHDSESVSKYVNEVERLLVENRGVIPPYIPSEFTIQSFFHRVYTIVNSYNFCE
ncbi:hypothetical protein FDP41_001690 [Naegleria fowleri]|uniref:alpha-1,6-mannosyl-glycoprotein 6-beta-N-acetylglucosaminyltransferase n=1 Tax=Naegleria fowleri TaxID=5763 RepID=A0A6A5BQF8_NAEFO|nr:uncharacterized protein FDP41_001690 [Naegleria fowleri]KAF0979347.1 hypothetical protein FDP41_001690 [Naegleria fowleri]